MAAAVLLFGPGSGAAWAHDALVGSGPAADATVESVPDAVTLEFRSAPQSLGAQVTVTGPYGVAVAAGKAEVSGTTVRQALADGLPAGSYRVEWRVASADGHPISGTYAFTVSGGAPVAQEQSAAGAAAPQRGAAGAMPATDDSPFPVVWVVVGAIVAVAVGLVVRQLRRPE